MSETDGAARLTSLLREFEVAMMVSFSNNGTPHGRPMVIASLEQPLGIWFISRSASEKIKEIKERPDVFVSCQRDKDVYLTMYGKAVVVEKPDKVRELWREAFRVWFPDGPDSSDISLVHFIPAEGEYWNNSGLEGVRYVLEVTAAYLSGSTPEVRTEGHEKINL